MESLARHADRTDVPSMRVRVAFRAEHQPRLAKPSECLNLPAKEQL